jgi:hypothetical protein
LRARTLLDGAVFLLKLTLEETNALFHALELLSQLIAGGRCGGRCRLYVVSGPSRFSACGEHCKCSQYGWQNGSLPGRGQPGPSKAERRCFGEGFRERLAGVRKKIRESERARGCS